MRFTVHAAVGLTQPPPLPAVAPARPHMQPSHAACPVAHMPLHTRPSHARPLHARLQTAPLLIRHYWRGGALRVMARVMTRVMAC